MSLLLFHRPKRHCIVTDQIQVVVSTYVAILKSLTKPDIRGKAPHITHCDQKGLCATLHRHYR